MIRKIFLAGALGACLLLTGCVSHAYVGVHGEHWTRPPHQRDHRHHDDDRWR